MLVSALLSGRRAPAVVGAVRRILRRGRRLDGARSHRRPSRQLSLSAAFGHHHAFGQPLHTCALGQTHRRTARAKLQTQTQSSHNIADADPRRRNDGTFADETLCASSCLRDCTAFIIIIPNHTITDTRRRFSMVDSMPQDARRSSSASVGRDGGLLVPLVDVSEFRSCRRSRARVPEVE